jgi:4-hydroxy-tetrahydrodipicolinate synthase
MLRIKTNCGKIMPENASDGLLAACDNAGVSCRFNAKLAEKVMFKGSIVALITPFRNGAVDAKGFQDFVDWQIKEGTEAVVPCGTTGESPTLTHEEHHKVVELCIEVAKGRIPVIAGTGSNSTAEAIALTKHAKKAGADAALVVTPYYNKPTQEGLFQHYKAIHDAVELPIIIYNIPVRSVIDMTVETMARLAKLPRIVGVKDATSDLVRPMKTRAACGPDFCQLSGEDATALPFLAAGGVGCISVTANVAPRLCAEMQGAWRKGDLTKAGELQDRLLPLHSALFTETSPGPVKYAGSLIGKCTPDLRLPLCEIAEATKEKVKSAMTGAGLLN